MFISRVTAKPSATHHEPYAREEVALAGYRTEAAAYVELYIGAEEKGEAAVDALAHHVRPILRGERKDLGIHPDSPVAAYPNEPLAAYSVKLRTPS